MGLWGVPLATYLDGLGWGFLKELLGGFLEASATTTTTFSLAAAQTPGKDGTIA